ncbi:FAD assembly factor SdhE [Chitinimonas lacunae]|uniref:FAD assembly factor SdhE n=1 Tax=Chitinimonas lacunae TaxID=1963018 RepID=A0ABV8MK41_9NEIS
MYTEADKNRIRWRSRRGLLELDLVLQRFLAHEFEHLDEATLAAYDDLLMLPDNDLLDLVDGRTDSDDPRFQSLVVRLRSWQAPGNQQ